MTEKDKKTENVGAFPVGEEDKPDIQPVLSELFNP